MRFLFTILIVVFFSGCSATVVTMTDKYEKGAFLKVPYHVKAIEVNGRLIKSSLISHELIIEIPEGRTEFVYKFHNIYDIHHGDDHIEVESDRMTVVFVAKQGDYYELNCPNPSSVEDAKALMPEIKSHLLHVESGAITNAIRGQIEERYHGIEIKKPYEELMHWWKKATEGERGKFKDWIKVQN
jgi:uncharacterized protein YccT (UPF0319 family)